MWTDGIDEVYELTVSLEAYKVSRDAFRVPVSCLSTRDPSIVAFLEFAKPRNVACHLVCCFLFCET